MNRNKLIFIFVFFVFILSSCSNDSYATLEEAIQKGIPYEVKDVVHTQEFDDITVVLYTTDAEGENVSYIKDPVLGIAFFKGNMKDGWINVGPNGWEYYENPQYTIYNQPYSEGNDEGEMLKDFDVKYGEINNKEIHKMEILDEETKDFKEAIIIEHGTNRYYFGIGYHPEVRAKGRDGEIIDQ